MGNMNFENLGLCSEIQKAVKYMGFEEASPILWRAGDCKTDPFSEKWDTDYYRYAGACDGSHETKDDQDGSGAHGCP